MAIPNNQNFTQKGMLASGLSGVQVTKFIPGARIYVKAADPVLAAPITSYMTKSNGAIPTGFTDLGSLDGDAKVTYTKNRKEVKTGIDNYLRAVYIDEKKMLIEFNLLQMDDVAVQNVLGLTPSTITSGSIINYQLGQETLAQKAIIIVYQNKLDGKEWQLYHPAAFLDGVMEKSSDAMVLKCIAELIFFTPVGATIETLASATIFA
jgi:hypothetical protein